MASSLELLLNVKKMILMQEDCAWCYEFPTLFNTRLYHPLWAFCAHVISQVSFSEAVTCLSEHNRKSEIAWI